MKNRLSEAWRNGKRIDLDESLANYSFKVNFLVSGQQMQLSSLERYQSWSGVFINFIKHVRIMNQPFSLVDFLDYCLFSILLIPSFIFYQRWDGSGEPAFVVLPDRAPFWLQWTHCPYRLNMVLILISQPKWAEPEFELQGFLTSTSILFLW